MLHALVNMRGAIEVATRAGVNKFFPAIASSVWQDALYDLGSKFVNRARRQHFCFLFSFFRISYCCSLLALAAFQEHRCIENFRIALADHYATCTLSHPLYMVLHQQAFVLIEQRLVTGK